MVTTQMLCLEDGDRAREIGADMAIGYHRSLLFRYLDTFPRPPGIPEWPELLPEPTPEEIDARRSPTGMTLIGDPDEVAGRDQQYADVGVDQVVFGMLSSTMPIEVAIETIETFGKHVLPQLRQGPGAPHHPAARRSQTDALMIRSCQSVAGSRAGHRPRPPAARRC